jgi:Reverse transcriptase (RNA-dependent DNA polymerase)
VKGREVEKEEIERMLKADVIEPANSEWACPVVLITKPDGSVRFCVDYRKLNAVTVKDSYPLPRMDECLDSLGDATIFSTLDCNSGYWQIVMKETDRNKTAFVTHCGVHHFKRMPFGLCNAPATFQRALDTILARVKWETALINLDDVIVY